MIQELNKNQAEILKKYFIAENESFDFDTIVLLAMTLREQF